MKNTGRLLGYILLNVVISAATILVVMILWERSHPLPSSGAIQPGVLGPGALATSAGANKQPGSEPLPIPISNSTPAPTLPPEQASDILNNVIGAGNLNDEYVLLVNKHDSILVLTGWRLQDEAGNTFTFPTFTLNKDGAVQVHTGPGTNSAIELFWSLESAVWKEGAAVRLLDPQGVQRATFTIP